MIFDASQPWDNLNGKWASDIPSGTDGVSASVYQNYLIFFGGNGYQYNDQSFKHDETWRFDITYRCWDKLNPIDSSQQRPLGRYGHTSVNNL